MKYKYRKPEITIVKSELTFNIAVSGTGSQHQIIDSGGSNQIEGGIANGDGNDDTGEIFGKKNGLWE